MSFAQEMRDFASGYKAIAESNRRSRYDRDTDSSKDDPLAGYGDKEEGGSFMDKLKGFFGGGEKTEGTTTAQAVPEQTDPTEKIYEKYNNAYKKAWANNDPKSAKKIMENLKLQQELPNPFAPAKPVAKPAVKAAPKPEAPAASGAPNNYGLPDPFKPKPQPTQKLPEQVDNRALPIDEELDPEAARAQNAVFTAEGGMIPAIGMEDDAPEVTQVSYEEEPQQDNDTVARDMSNMAMPGYAAAYRLASQEIAPPSGLPDEAAADKGAEAFARGDNAATPDEVKAIDAIIDPNNRLPPNAKSQARVAAIWKYYSERGQEDKAAELINRLSAYDRKNSQTRGMLAMRAMDEGNTEAAAKLIKDAYEQDLPGDQLIQPAVLQNGNIQADVIQDGQVVESVQATPEEFKGLIQKVASGQAHSQQAVNLISQWDANKKNAKAKATSSGPAIDEDIKRGLLTTRRAYAQALSEKDDSPEWAEYFDKVKAAVQAQEQRAIAFADKAGGKDRDTILRSLGIGNVPTAATVPSPSKGGGKLNQSNLPMKKNKKGEDEVDELEVIRRRLQNADILEQHGVRIDENGKAIDKREPGYKPTPEERKAAKDSIDKLRKPLVLEFLDKAYDEAEDSPGYKENYKERKSENEQALDAYLKSISRNDVRDPRAKDGADRAQALRMIDAVRRRNDTMDPEDIAKLLDDVARDGSYEFKFDSKGRMVYGDKRVFINKDTLSVINKQRAANKADSEAAEKAGKAKEASNRERRIVGAIDDSVRGAMQQYNGEVPALAVDSYAPAIPKFTPRDAEDEADMRNELRAIETQLAATQARLHPSRRGQYNPDIDRMERQAEDLRNRLARAGNSRPTQRPATAVPMDRDRLNSEYPIRREGWNSGVQIP